MAEAPQPRKPGFFDAVRTVSSAFFGVRKRTDHEQESMHLSPVHVIIVAAMAAAIFVMALLFIVNKIVS
jgi:ABC-type xylose transport system permease subunit